MANARQKYHMRIVAVLVTLVLLCLVSLGVAFASSYYATFVAGLSSVSSAEQSIAQASSDSAQGQEPNDSSAISGASGPDSATGTSSSVTTVKVGYYESRNFLEGADGSSSKDGFGYEYLQRVASYSSWHYEYVYGTWAELYEKLKKGEIDLLPGVARTSDHEEDALFPSSSMLSETFYVYKRDSDDSVKSGKSSSLNDKRIGVVDASNAETSLTRWLGAEGVKAKQVVYSSTAKLKKAWDKGKIDLMVSSDNVVYDLDDIEPAFMLGKTPFYLAVARSDQKLLGQLDDALKVMNSQDRAFLDDLEVRYSTDSSLRNYLTADESKWIKTHESVTVGYLDNYLPFCATNSEGNATGLFLDVLGAVFDALPGSWYPEIKTKAFSSQMDMIDALKKGEIDLAFPVDGNTWYAEDGRYLVSSPVVSPSMVLVSRGGFDSDEFDLNVATGSVAVNKNNQMQENFVQKMFPDADIVGCSSIEECIDAVKAGRADCTVVNSLRAGAILNSEPSLVTLQLPGSDMRSFAVPEGDGVFLRLLNRGLGLIGSNYGGNAALQHTSGLYKYTFADFVRDNLLVIILLLACALLFAIFMVVRHVSRMRRDTELEIERNRILEEALDRAERAGRARDVLLRNLSHDIRTPLNGILGLVEKLEVEPGSGLASADRQKIKSSSDQLLHLVDNLLEMSRLKTGDLELASEVFSLEDLICDSVDSARSRADGHRVSVSCELSSEVKDAPKVKGSPLYLRQVLGNVLDNAIRYNCEDGQVLVKADVFSSEEGTVTLVCSVKDTGVGMSEEDASRIFEPFFQVNDGPRSEYHGSGLGMSIVKALVDLMGGSIGVLSKESEGTKVVVSLPFDVADDDGGPDADASDEDGKGSIDGDVSKGKGAASGDDDVPGTVDADGLNLSLRGVCCLVAEDNELNLELAQFFLERAGAVVVAAKNGKEAVSLFAESDPGLIDVVLMDIMMPEMDGCEAASAIRALKRPDAKSVPIVAMTANVLEDDRRRMFEAGMNVHLPKPVDSEKLISVVKSQIEARSEAGGSSDAA